MTIGEEDLRKEVTLSASLNSDAKTSWLTSETTDGDQRTKQYHTQKLSLESTCASCWD